MLGAVVQLSEWPLFGAGVNLVEVRTRSACRSVFLRPGEPGELDPAGRVTGVALRGTFGQLANPTTGAPW